MGWICLRFRAGCWSVIGEWCGRSDEALLGLGCGRSRATRWFVPVDCGLEGSWPLSTCFLGAGRSC